jgi:hypothetical protein
MIVIIVSLKRPRIGFRQATDATVPMCTTTTTYPTPQITYPRLRRQSNLVALGAPMFAALHFLGIIFVVYDSKGTCNWIIECSFGEICFVEEVLCENDRGYGYVVQFFNVFHRSTLDIATVESRIWQIRV